jgi:tetratricopeptide (TPR) repeat protein
MIEQDTKARRHGGTKQSAFIALVLSIVCAFAFGCQSAPRNMNAVHAYYRYDFTGAREALRGDANLRNDEQIVLNNTRLGIAALGDGDLEEAEQALGKSFEFLSTAGLNKDRTAAAVFVHEGVKIWKGEPFEQALTYHYVATLYALMNDWENARAAAANSLFRLTDFGADQNAETLARHAAKDSKYLERGYTAVDTNFALGFVMQAIGADLSGAAGSDDLFNAALEINPELESIVEALRARDYDTLLVVDYGKGPTKIAYGPDEALVRFAPQDRTIAELEVAAGGQRLISAPMACNVNEMAVDHRWNNLDDVRRAKSMIGTGLLYGGLITTAYGADRRDSGVALAGLAAMGAGLLTKAGAKADTRYCEFVPQAIYMAPLRLGSAADLRVSIPGDPNSLVILDDVQPGSPGKPRTIYLRILGPGSPAPTWLAQRKPLYSNNHTGVWNGGDGYPWILGGRDVSTPSRAVLQNYQANGYLRNMTMSELQELYASENVLIGSGMESRPDVRKNPSFRHVLEGGTGLFTPHPYSMGYKRLMCAMHEPYRPKSDVTRNAAAAIRVNGTVNVARITQEVRE